jgi:ABC-type multidrug transport system ATPase subunit
VQVRQLIALTGQFASVDDELTGTENMMMIGRLLGFSRARSRARAAELLERFDLTGGTGNRYVRSGPWRSSPGWPRSPWPECPAALSRTGGR